MLFNQITLNRLKRLQLIAQQVRQGKMQGERRSTKRGQSIEFADYRNYVPGDDLRRLDWNVYARTEKPFIKLMEDEEDLAVYIIIDASPSMDWGTDDEHKLTFASRLAAGLSVVSLFSGDLLTLEVWGNGQQLNARRGAGNLNQVLNFLSNVKPGYQIRLEENTRFFTSKNRRAGLVIFISDLLFRTGLEDGLKTLQQTGNQVVVLHTLSPNELHPQMAGDLRLLDSEIQASQEVSLTPGILQLYSQRVSEWQDNIHAFCQRRRIQYFNLTTDSAWDEFILVELRREGIVK